MSASTPQPIIALIAAAARNGVIGRAGVMPWRMPSDLKTFRRLTLDKPVVMGRKTFQSIGKPLPGRDNIVITRDAAFTAAGIQVTGSLDAAVDLARAAAIRSGLRLKVCSSARSRRQRSICAWWPDSSSAGTACSTPSITRRSGRL